MADDVILNGNGYVTGVFRSAKDSTKVFSKIQRTNTVKPSSLQPALCLLDIHGLKRADFHNSLLVKLRETLLEKLQHLDDKQAEKLLKETFHFIAKDQLREIVVTIMERLQTIPDKYLSSISENQQIYEICPLNIKRQIWQTTQELFGEAVSPFLDRYIEDKESKMFSQIGEDGSAKSFFSYSPKARRQSEIVQGLVGMIGNSEHLYTILLQFLRTLFIRTRVSHYCTLRADLLMCLHDTKVGAICDSDPCHKFAWCLDACVQAGDIDTRKARELYTFLQSMISSGNDEIISDIAMLLRDPYAINVICNSIVRALITLMQQEKLPRDSADLGFLIRLLQVSLDSLEIVENQKFKLKQDSEMLLKFLPSLLEIMLEAQLQSLCTKLAEPYTKANFWPKLSSSIKDPVSFHIVCSYALTLARTRESKQLMDVLNAIAATYQENVVEIPDGFLHQMANHMSLNSKCLQEASGLVLLHKFWIPCSSHDDGMLHLCRLLWGIQSHLDPDTLDTTLRKMKPNQRHSELAYSQYTALVEHIKGSQ